MQLLRLKRMRIYLGWAHVLPGAFGSDARRRQRSEEAAKHVSHQSLQVPGHARALQLPQQLQSAKHVSNLQHAGDVRHLAKVLKEAPTS